MYRYVDGFENKVLGLNELFILTGIVFIFSVIGKFNL